MVDDVYLNGYARHLGVTTSMVYISLCRHVDRDQYAFPSQTKIAEELNISKRTVINSIATLKKWNLISVERERTERKWARNSYFLLDKTVWKKPSSATIAPEPPSANDDIHQVQPLHTKDTHIEGYTYNTRGSEFSNSPTFNSFLQEKKQELSKKMEMPKVRGVSTDWQDHALRDAEKLGINLEEKETKLRWFSLYKQAYNSRRQIDLAEAYSYVIDHPTATTPMDKVKLFFWRYSNGKNNK